MDFYKGVIPIIDSEGPATDVSHPKGMSFGLVPRDYSACPQSMFAQLPSEMKLIEETDWDGYFDMQEETKSSLEHIYLGEDGKSPAFVNLDQNGFPDCWTHSTGHALMIDRMRQKLPVVRLNAVAVATMLGETNGGWCGLSAKFARENGYPVVGTGPGEWPYQSRGGHDTPELRANMKLHKVTEDWCDLTKQVWEQNLTQKQLATCLFNNNPCPVDFSWWGHSVCAIRWVQISKGEWGLLILNSWKDWGRFGLAVLRGSQKVPMGAICTRASVSSAA